MKYLVTTDWLEKNSTNVKILDASWHMPNTKRNGLKEYQIKHIADSQFFDLDQTSNKDSKLPHMLPSKNSWEKSISQLGIKNSDHIIIYDNSDVLSSCRIWYNFLYFGHSSSLVSVLDGGLIKWIKENRDTTKIINKIHKSDYIAEEKTAMVLNKDQINLNIKSKTFELIDARSKERFNGLQPEPRKELRGGNIKGSKNIPFMDLINKNDHTFKNKEELKSVFKQLDLDLTKGLAFTCGSGVTASILSLANSIISGKNPVIYDGSWSEYGLK